MCPRSQLLLVAGIAYAVACVGIVAAPLDDSWGMDFIRPGTGLVIGTLLAHATFLSHWSVFGPLPLISRLPLAVLWLASLQAALIGNLGLSVPEQTTTLLTIAAGTLLCWLSNQFPAWLLKGFFSLRLAQCHDPPAAGFEPVWRFRLGQLCAFTACVAVLLGLGRLGALSLAPRAGHIDRDAVVMIGTVFVTPLFTSSPLFLAWMICQRARWILALSGVMLVGLASWSQIVLLRWCLPPSLDPEFADLAWINGFMMAWIIGLGIAVRSIGFRLTPALRRLNVPASSGS